MMQLGLAVLLSLLGAAGASTLDVTATATAGEQVQVTSDARSAPTPQMLVGNVQSSFKLNEATVTDRPSAPPPPAPSSTCIQYTPTPPNPKLKCGFQGTLKNPAQPYLEQHISRLHGYPSAFAYCRDLCLNDTSTPCDSFGFDAAARNLCDLYNTRIDPQEPRKSSGPVYYNRRCFVKTCGDSLIKGGNSEPRDPANGVYCYWSAEAHAGSRAGGMGDGGTSASTSTCAPGNATNQNGVNGQASNAIRVSVSNSHGNAGGGIFQGVTLQARRTYDFAMTYYLPPQNMLPNPDLNISFLHGFGVQHTDALFIPGAQLVENSPTTVYGHFTAPTMGQYIMFLAFQHGYVYQDYPQQYNFNAAMFMDDVWLVERPRYPGS